MVKVGIKRPDRDDKEHSFHEDEANRLYQGDVSRQYEFPDPTPIAPPVGYNPQPSVFDQMRQMIHAEKLAAMAAAGEGETFEEADDFVVGDEDDDFAQSPYEEFFIGEVGSFDPRFGSVVEQINEHIQKAKAAKSATPPEQGNPPPQTPTTKPASRPSRAPQAPDPALDGPESE